MGYINCLNCEKRFSIRPYRLDTAKFCSQRCKSEYGRKKVECLNCRKIFIRKVSGIKKHIFCSKQCYLEYGRIKVKCENCEVIFLSTRYKEETVKFCSKECQKRFYASDTQYVCRLCKKPFTRKRWQKSRGYCSKKCFYNRSPKVPVICSGCGTKFSIYPSRKSYFTDYYCSKKCNVKFGPVGKLTDNKIIDNNYQRLARALRHTAVYLLWKKACIGRDRGECTECGNTRALTVHHCRISMYEMCVKHGFKKELVEADTTFVDISNGITQCRSCHAKQHRKGIMNG